MIKKRFYVVGLLLFLLSLGACSKHADLDKNSCVFTIPAKETNEIDNRKYNELMEEIKLQFDSSSSGQVEVKVENNVSREEIPNRHDEIKVLFTGELRDKMKTAIEALDADKATREENNLVTVTRLKIGELAQKLPVETSAISLEYLSDPSSDYYVTAALALPDKDVIPIGKLILE